jgi:hypothetical protein
LHSFLEKIREDCATISLQIELLQCFTKGERLPRQIYRDSVQVPDKRVMTPVGFSFPLLN